MAKTAKEKLNAARETIAKLTAALPELERAAANEFDITDIQPGERIEFNYGRAGKVNILQGKVLGVKVPEGKGSPFIKVAVGDGVDLEVVSIVQSQLIKRLDVAEASAEDTLGDVAEG